LIGCVLLDVALTALLFKIAGAVGSFLSIGDSAETAGSLPGPFGLRFSGGMGGIFWVIVALQKRTDGI
jgi:hypothetical protein